MRLEIVGNKNSALTVVGSRTCGKRRGAQNKTKHSKVGGGNEQAPAGLSFSYSPRGYYITGAFTPCIGLINC